MVNSGVSSVTSKPISSALNCDNTVTLAPVSKKNEVVEEAPLFCTVAFMKCPPCTTVGCDGLFQGRSISRLAMLKK